MFNDGVESQGIDKEEFYAGLVQRFGLNAPRSLTDKLFNKIDNDGSGHIDTKELCDHLFPQTADYTQKSWYVRSEEQAMKRLEQNASSLRGDPLQIAGTRLEANSSQDQERETESLSKASSLRFSSPWQI